MSGPVAIPRSGRTAGNSLSSSPAAALSWGVGGAYGSSPPASRGSSFNERNPHAAAKKIWKRLEYDAWGQDDAGLTDCQIGFVETKQQAERKSGAEAWSLRIHDQVAELPYADFVARFGCDDIPFHRIAYIRQHGATVWESEFHRGRLQAEGDACGLGASPPNASASWPRSHPHGDSPRAPPTPLPVQRTAQASPAANADAGRSDAAAAASGASATPEGATAAEDDACAAPAPDFSALPEACWTAALTDLGVRDLCCISRTSRWLRGLASCRALWAAQYRGLFGADADAAWSAATLRRVCRRSELRSARWLEAEVGEVQVGFNSTLCLQLDESKVVSGDGSAVRLWSHTTGRRIATLQGHAGLVRCVAADEELIVSGDSAGALRVWGVDDLRALRSLRHHTAAVSGVALLHGMPISAGLDGQLCLWDVGAGGGAPVVALDVGQPVHALALAAGAGQLVSAGWTVDVWDLEAAQQLLSLEAPHGWADAAASVESSGGAGVEPWPFTCVSAGGGASGGLVAAGSATGVVLWDARCPRPLGCLAAPARSEGCVGVQLDDWKLLTGFSDASHSLGLYDLRAAGNVATGGSAWGPEPLLTLCAASRVTCFQFHGQRLIVGQEGSECVLWTFGAPAATGVADGGGDAGEGGERERGGRKKKGPAKVGRKQTRYPKRTTR